MNILVTGATGFIAAQIVTDLLAAGHKVTCCVRDVNFAKNIFPSASVIKCNFISDTQPEIWLPRLKNIDVVINCVGVFYHPQKEKIWKVHYNTPKALFDACVQAGVKKVIQLSALGITKFSIDYAQSKLRADEYLASLPIASIVLRPSLVYGRGSYGGTSLFRGLTGMPFILPIPGKGSQQFQPIYLHDLSRAIVKLVDLEQTKPLLLEAVSNQKISLKEILQQMRSWLGFKKAIVVHVPMFFIRMGSLLGNLFPYSTLNTTAYVMMQKDNVSSSPELFERTVDFPLRNFKEGLYQEPSTVQDRWHAKLYFLRTALQFSIAFIWIWSGLCSAFFYPVQQSYQLLADIGVSTFWQPILLYGASFVNIALGIATLLQFKLKKIYLLQLLLIVVYTLIISWKLPLLWLEPFAPIAKNIPLLIAICIALALESER